MNYKNGKTSSNKKKVKLNSWQRNNINSNCILSKL